MQEQIIRQPQEIVSRAQLLQLLDQYRIDGSGRDRVLRGELALALPDGRSFTLSDEDGPEPERSAETSASAPHASQPFAGPPPSPPRQPSGSASPTRPADPDAGDQVAEILRARNEGRKPAAWALQPLTKQRADQHGGNTPSRPTPTTASQSAPAGDMGDQVVAILRKRGP